jgi:hypothetical protein
MNLQQRIDDFLEGLVNMEDDFDEKQSALTDFVEMELMDQRSICAMAAFRICGDDDVRQACIDAVEKK